MADQSQLARLGLFDARVPRYTSYPTAPQFSSDIDKGFFRQSLQNLPENKAISLYIHIPFCRRLCWFCACRTQGTRTDKPVRAYLDTLLQEIKLLKTALPDGLSLSRMHWGGGTPTLLAPDMMDELSSAIFEFLPMAQDAEFSVEIDPSEIDEDRLFALSKAGMNRASVGVQDFDPEIQGIIGRIQSYDVTKNAVELIRSLGVKSLNADILYGLPEQNQQRMSDSVQKLLSLSPDRVALYGYAHVPWMAKRQQMIPTDTLPIPEERLALYNTAKKLFLWDGYKEIGIDHFATPTDSLAQASANGRLRRNFQGYTDDQADTLIGLGASSISRFIDGYAQNAPATSAYSSRINSGSFATSRGHKLTDDDKLRSRLIESLMCDFKIDTDEICTLFDISRPKLQALYDPVVEKFGGMVETTSRELRILDHGRPLTRMIARAFDAYDLSKAGHSSAV